MTTTAIVSAPSIRRRDPPAQGLLLSLAAILVVAFGGMPSGGAAQAQTGQITGTVVEEFSGRPLAGIQIMLEGDSLGLGAVTDANGRFLIGGLPPGDYRVLVDQVGFMSRVVRARVMPGQAESLRIALMNPAVEAALPARERADPVYNALLHPLEGRDPIRLAAEEPVTLRFFIGAAHEESVLGGDASIPEALRVARDPTPLGVVLDCEVCAEATSQSARITYDPETASSDEARFEFVPRRSAVASAGGLGRLGITVMRNGVELDAIEIQVMVGEPSDSAREAYQTPRLHRVGRFPRDASAGPDLVLFAGPSSGSAPVPVRFQAFDDEVQRELEDVLGPDFQGRILETGVNQADLEELAQRVYVRLSDIVLARNEALDRLYAGQPVPGISTSSSLRLQSRDSAAVVEALDEEGRELFRRVFAHGSAPLPPAMARVEALARRRYEAGDPLVVRIHNVGPWVPWQVLASVWEGPSADPERFWGARYALGVRQILPGRDGPVATDLAWPAGDDLILATHRHEDRITRRADHLQDNLARRASAAVKRHDGRDALLAGLRDAGEALKFLLVFTHGESGGADPSGYPGRPQLIFADDDVLVPPNVDALGDALPPTLDADASLLFRSQPVVFLNACESGTAGLQPTTNNNFVGSFLRLGASAVIATESSVGIAFASSFADDFSEALFQGVAVAEAMRGTRLKHLAEKGSALGLIYSLYGNPSARFVSR